MNSGMGIQEHTTLTTQEQLTELIMSGLRTTKGVTFDSVFDELKNDKIMEEIFDLKMIDEFCSSGLLERTHQCLCATRKGKKY